MKKLTLAIIVAAFYLTAVDVYSQSNSPSIDLKAEAGQVAQDAGAAIKGLGFSQGANVGVFAVENGSKYGIGLEVSTALTNTPIQAGFAILALQQPDNSWTLYDSSFNLSVKTHETIPLLDIPFDLVIGSGPGIRYHNGTTLIEQSFLFSEFTWNPSKNIIIHAGVGVVHLSDYVKAMPAANAAVTWRF